MKNKTIFLSLLASIIILLGFEISGARLKFGGATLSDSTNQPYITTNKGLVVNGPLKITDSLQLSYAYLEDGGALFWDAPGNNPYIIGSSTDIEARADNFDITTIYGTSLAQFDSANGVFTYLPGYSNNGRGLVKTKVIQSTLGSTTPGNFINIAHGISHNLSKVILIVKSLLSNVQVHSVSLHS